VRYSNHQVAELFRTIGDLLEIKGEVIYKILAYRKAADSLNNLSRDLYEIMYAGELTEIPGVGKAIAEKIEEFLKTGKLQFYEKLVEQVPDSLAAMLQIPDLGPKKIKLFWQELGITTVDELQEAAANGQLRKLHGMGEKSEARILAGIRSLAQRGARMPLGTAWPFAQELISYLRNVPGVTKVETAGSLRRMRATVGDLDILAAAHESSQVMQAFVGHPSVARIIGHGGTKSSVEFQDGKRVQLWVHPPRRFGTALQYATGSRDHNVRLRELALKQGYSLSEHALSRQGGNDLLFAEEEQVYHHLGLPWIPPELREDRGEVQAALAGNLPELIRLEDMHSTWSDGALTIRQMAEAALERNLQILAFTDHSVSLAVAGGLSIEDLHAQARDIETVQEELGNKIILLRGTEVEIRVDGSLDYPDEVLEKLDIVVASLHSGLRQPRQQVTQRMINAIRNPHVDIIGHPTGRLIPNRAGADLDMETVIQAAGEYGVALEINAHPSRLDLDDIFTRRAVELGVLLSINTDAHSAHDLDMLHYGVAVARRGWAQAENVINTWDKHRLTDWLQDRGKQILELP